MSSKLCPTTRAVQSSQFSTVQLVGECTLDERKTSSKRLAEQSLERGSKRSRTSQSSSEDSGQTFNTARSVPAYSDPPVSKGHHTDPIIYTVGECTSDGHKKSSKRLAEESLERGSKRSRRDQSSSEDSGQTFNTARSVPAYSDPPVSKGEIQKLSSKRKSTSVGRYERPWTRSRATPGPSESPDHQAATEASTSDDTAPPHSRAALNAKYDEGELLGKGGFGSVFAGHRKADNLPVAIKHIVQEPSLQLTGIIMELEGKRCKVPLEVALLLKLQPKDGETSAVVALLDWYDLEDELILVLERPVPCVDMVKYIHSQALSENEAKILTRQLVDALIEVHSKGVFHRDIKLGNILVETGSDVPRVRIIDFGCGEFLTKRQYHTNQGTRRYTSPEWFIHGCYKAEPATVWQLGVTVFVLLHKRLPFKFEHEIIFVVPDIDDSLSIDCQDFLMSCLVKNPESRYTLEELRSHFWLM